MRGGATQGCAPIPLAVVSHVDHAPSMAPLIRLYDHVGLGLIIAFPSGVRYSNQTCGHSCDQPELEGVFAPLRNTREIPSLKVMSPENDLDRYFDTYYQGTGAPLGLSSDDADAIEAILEKYHLHGFLSVDRSRLRDSHEAWVWVSLHRSEQPKKAYSLVAGFEPYPRSGVLTWSNSD